MELLALHRRLRRGPAYNPWLLAALLLVCGVWGNLHVMSHTSTWWQARSHVALNGTLLVAIRSSDGQKRFPAPRLIVDYRYAFNGQQYRGSTLGLKRSIATIDGETVDETMAKLQATLDGDRRVRVWVDPAQPQVSRLDRTFNWNESWGSHFSGWSPCLPA